MDFISIDTETTGLSFENDRVIQFGAAIFRDDKEIYKETFLIYTDVENGGVDVNGISREDIEKYGINAKEAFCIIVSLLEKKPNQVCIYNAPFDLSFLACEFRRHGIQYDFRRLKIYDPLVMFRRLYPYQPAKLVNVAERFGIPIENAHDAGADSAAAGHVFLELRRRHGIAMGTYLNKMQQRWHTDWAEGFKDWCGKTGRPEPIIEPWPIREEWACFLRNEQSRLF